MDQFPPPTMGETMTQSVLADILFCLPGGSPGNVMGQQGLS